MKAIAARIQEAYLTSEEWKEHLDHVLLQSEKGVEIDTGFYKVGNGQSKWENLPYYTQEYILNKVEMFQNKAWNEDINITSAEQNISLKLSFNIPVKQIKITMASNTSKVIGHIRGKQIISEGNITLITADKIQYELQPIINFKAIASCAYKVFVKTSTDDVYSEEKWIEAGNFYVENRKYFWFLSNQGSQSISIDLLNNNSVSFTSVIGKISTGDDESRINFKVPLEIESSIKFYANGVKTEFEKASSNDTTIRYQSYQKKLNPVDIIIVWNPNSLK